MQTVPIAKLEILMAELTLTTFLTIDGVMQARRHAN